MYGLFDAAPIINYTEVMAVCDDIRTFIERELLLTTDESEIRAYQKILAHVNKVSKAVVEGKGV